MSAEGKFFCLDVTRLALRAGRGPDSGIDRVERAYLGHLCGMPAGDAVCLVRGRFTYRLIPPSVVRELLGAETGRDAVAAALSRAAEARAWRGALAGLLRQASSGRRVSYLNVGHLAVSRSALAQIGRVSGACRTLMIHDTIPLDHPDLSGPGAPARFARVLSAAGLADRVLVPSSAVANDLRRHFGARGRTVPPVEVVPLGVSVAAPDPAALPRSLPPETPYFVTVGTIEPRKDHALLLDIWDRLAAEGGPVPALVIAGRRGWRNEGVFARLDRLRGSGRVIEVAGLSDAALYALVRRARALLMPSMAEGFGLPVAEAADLGTPVVACPLPVYAETVGDYPIYAPQGDLYSWTRTIRTLAEQDRPERRGGSRPVLPTWEDHFAAVFGKS
jgi:glycosyltransferase involved in cell wall biosynthesis